MTRINCVPPSELCRQHLVAEYRELPRIPGLARVAQLRGRTPETLNAPASYTLGRGHMLFFYSRGLFLLRRQQALIREMRRRGFNPQFTCPSDLFVGLQPEWMQDWEPDPAALELNRARLAERMPKTV